MEVEDGHLLELAVRLPASMPLRAPELECRRKVRRKRMRVPVASAAYLRHAAGATRRSLRAAMLCHTVFPAAGAAAPVRKACPGFTPLPACQLPGTSNLPPPTRPVCHHHHARTPTTSTHTPNTSLHPVIWPHPAQSNPHSCPIFAHFPPTHHHPPCIQAPACLHVPLNAQVGVSEGRLRKWLLSISAFLRMQVWQWAAAPRLSTGCCVLPACLGDGSMRA